MFKFLWLLQFYYYHMINNFRFINILQTNAINKNNNSYSSVK